MERERTEAISMLAEWQIWVVLIVAAKKPATLGIL